MRNERGSVAIVAATSMLLLFALAALAVDLGNAFARKRDLQSQADFAALAGADQLGNGNSKVGTDPAVVAVAGFLNENQPQDDDGFTTVAPTQLVDNDERNGEVYFLSGDRMRVLAPLALVRFGLANAIGFSSVEVNAEATVQIRSGGGVLPFYAVDGCDYGPQTLSDPASGHSTPLNLAYASDNGGASPASISPKSVEVNPTPTPDMTIDGTNFEGPPSDAAAVGFFRNDGSTPVVVSAPFLDLTDSRIEIAAVPAAVTSVEDVWWVRILKNGKWSPVADAVPFVVGGAILECVGASLEGNFGSLQLPRTDSSNSTGDGWLPINISEGLQDPLTLETHDAAAAPYGCVDGYNGAVVSWTAPPDLKPGTNCVDTDTGLPSTAATAGFITGGGNGPAKTFVGRLDRDTTAGCGADSSNRNARWNTDISIPGPGSNKYWINDDLLTCFFTADATTVGQISQKNYAGGVALSPRIYDSPRFFWLPVLGVDPSSGGSDRYSIVAFRPGFITDQPLTANRVNKAVGTATTHNGFTIASGKVSAVKVVFFSASALPPPDESTPTVAYMGYGPKAIRLVN